MNIDQDEEGFKHLFITPRNLGARFHLAWGFLKGAMYCFTKDYIYFTWHKSQEEDETN